MQRNDIAMAITKFDQFDFLIDIVPRDELKPPKRQVMISDFHKLILLIHSFKGSLDILKLK